jgi:hypothetical protein
MRTNLGDGEASLTFQSDVERIQIAHDRIRAAAKQIKTAGDGRTSTEPAPWRSRGPYLPETLPASTVLGADAKTGYLAGYGWLPAQRALKLAVQKDAV